MIESFWCGNGGAGTNAWGHVDETGKLQRPYLLRIIYIRYIHSYLHTFYMQISHNITRSSYSRSECPTNGAPDVAGLHAILPKLLALPKEILADRYADSAAAWAAALELLPPLALEECHWGEQTPPDLLIQATTTRQHGSRVNMGCRTCAPNHNSTSCWCNGHMPCYPPTNKSTIVAIAGDYAGIREHNHENQACYSIWPFRQYAVGKPDVDIGVATYLPRIVCEIFTCRLCM